MNNLNSGMFPKRACKDCTHFYKNGFENVHHICFRPRDVTRFNPVDGKYEAAHNNDVYDERSGAAPELCGIDAVYFEAKNP